MGSSHDPAAVWSQALETLSHQMTRATYDYNFLGSSLSFDGEVWTVAARDELTKERLEGQLFRQIGQVLRPIIGGNEPPVLRFAVASAQGALAPAKAEVKELPAVEPLARADFYAAFFEKGGAGYSMDSHYATQFWQPYLGRAYLLWKRLDMDSRASIKEVKNRWSEPA